MFSQFNPSFGDSKSKICHRDLTRVKIYHLFYPPGYEKICPVRDSTLIDPTDAKMGSKNRILGLNSSLAMWSH